MIDGRTSINFRSSSWVTFLRFFRHFLLVFCLCRVLSIFRPCTLLRKRSIESPDMEGRCFSLFVILPAILSGERPWSKSSSTRIRSALCSTIFIPWYFAYFLRAYALCTAFLGSYLPHTEFRAISSEIVETLLSSVPAIERSECPLCRRIPSSCRSLLFSFDAFFFFPWLLDFFHQRTLAECSDSSADSGLSLKASLKNLATGAALAGK